MPSKHAIGELKILLFPENEKVNVFLCFCYCFPKTNRRVCFCRRRCWIRVCVCIGKNLENRKRCLSLGRKGY